MVVLLVFFLLLSCLLIGFRGLNVEPVSKKTKLSHVHISGFNILV